MIVDLLMKNPTLAFEVLVMVGGWLVVFGAMRSKMEANQKATAKIEEKLEEWEARWREHLQDDAPHKSCLVEAAKQSEMSLAIRDCREAISRVEGWVMALANKQGIKGPAGNGG